MKRNICYVYQDQFPWEIRVEKISRSLAEKGITVHIISRNRDGIPVLEPYQGNIYIHRLSKGFNSIIRKFINFPAFFSPFWLKVIISTVKETGSELIIVRDLPLSITAWIAGKVTKRPVLLDMAENYPAMIRDTWRFRGPKLFDYLIRNPYLLSLMEKYIVPKMDGVLVVSAPSAKRLSMMGMPEDRIFIVGNTPALWPGDPLDDKKEELTRALREKSNFILIYTGGMEESRGLEVLIRAIPRVAREEPGVLVVLVGKGTSENKLQQVARELGVEKHIVWMGWQNHNTIPSLLEAADIGVIPHYVTDHTDTTIPNKIFDYMLQKKPVIATHSKTLSEIINSSGCGLIYKDDSPAELAEAIITLRSRELREKLGVSGFNAVLDRYNWKNDESRLLSAVNLFSKSETPSKNKIGRH